MAASLWWDDADTSQHATQDNRKEELLVFGYACKLFRDDEKALAVDKGKLLIPWMGDEKLLIDRYDGRGHLFDVRRYDADNLTEADYSLTEEEEAIEKACDEERYLELHTDVREAEIYEEEEWKRYYLSLQEGYQAVGFGYDQPAAGDAALWQANTAASGQDQTAEDKVFVPPEELHVPSGMQIPSCIKQNARIEKTAKFIAQQGVQMEIMLKTKQAGNSQFEFLSFENSLNAYYKHMVSMIKSGKYKPVQKQEEETNNEEHTNDNYLHPSLSSTALPPPPPPPSKPIELPKVSIHDTPYGALINSIRKHTGKTKSKKEEDSIQQPSAPVESSYTHPSLPSVEGSSLGYHHPDNPPPPGTEPVTLPMVSALDGQKFVEELYGGKAKTEAGERRGRKKKRRRRSSSSDSSSSSSSSSSNSSRSRSLKKKRKPSVSPPRMHGPAPILPPPPDVCPIVDRMALYVAKNGAEFEMVVMNRKDPRFQFLNEYHAYYPYYKLKKEAFIEEFSKNKEEDEKSGNSQRCISFSIKSRPKEQEVSQPAAKPKPKLFEYDSSEEGEETKEEKPVQETFSESASLTTPPSRAMLVDEDSQKEIEEKLKDKLANAVKERLSQTNKERQLQQERKKKAAMFLNLIKGGQSSNPSPPPSEDSSSMYIGEASPAPVVYEYDNGQTLHEKLSSHHKRRRSPTPPSAYNLDKRTPLRPSPPRWVGRQSTWMPSSQRERSPAWSRRSRDRAVPRSKSRSPHRKEEKKKKHKHSKSSRLPPHEEKSREHSSTKHYKEKSKHKSKDHDRERRKKEKSKHKSRERDTDSIPRSKTSFSADSDVELLDKSPHNHVEALRDHPAGLMNGDLMGAGLGNAATFDLSSIPVPGASPLPSGSVESIGRDLRPSALSNRSSVSNSPSLHNPGSRGSTPGRTFADSTGVSASSDLMSKVRAMLKKSRENVPLEDGEAAS